MVQRIRNKCYLACHKLSLARERVVSIWPSGHLRIEVAIATCRHVFDFAILKTNLVCIFQEGFHIDTGLTWRCSQYQFHVCP